MATRNFDLSFPEAVFVDREALQICRGCGCTDDHACPGGCFWIEPDLCNRCAELIRARGQMPARVLCSVCGEPLSLDHPCLK